MSLALTVPGILGRGGRLAGVIGAAYEARDPQLAMAEAVQRAVLTRAPLVVEAGTGTDKSLAHQVGGLTAKPWGQTILNALPPFRQTSDLAQVARFLAAAGSAPTTLTACQAPAVLGLRA